MKNIVLEEQEKPFWDRILLMESRTSKVYHLLAYKQIHPFSSLQEY